MPAAPNQRTTPHGPIPRLELLRLGLAGLAGLGLPGLARLRAESGIRTSERTAINLVFHGGASHLETYDPKPDAPAEYRGPFGTIDTKVPGMRLCELLPRHAAIADRFTILRSMVHAGFCHGIGQQQMFTGQEVRQFTPKSQYPEFLATMYRHLGVDPTGLEFHDFSGRPIPVLNGGSPIPELVARA